MKMMIAFLFLMTFDYASSATIELEKFDQVKLTEFLGRMPRSIRQKTVTKSSPQQGMRIENVFPDDKNYPFSFKCLGTYYRNSPYVSAANCSLSFDETSTLFQRSNDEAKIVITDPAMVNGLREAIPEGRLVKEFRSYEKRLGYTLTGAWAWIFDYYLSCTTKECTLKFSLKK